MRSYTNLVVLALAASALSPALSAPIQYGYGHLLVELKHQAYLISGIPLGFSVGWIPIPLSMSFVASNFLVPVTMFIILTLQGLPKPEHTLPKPERTLPVMLTFRRTLPIPILLSLRRWTLAGPAPRSLSTPTISMPQTHTETPSIPHQVHPLEVGSRNFVVSSGLVLAVIV
jgi:hypothetical protein